jgi:long-chain acyl-CoA synthetase
VLREEKIFNAREMLRWEIETLSTQLPGHKRILSYDLATDDLPRTTTRKLKRFEIERQFASAQEKGPTVSADRERSEPAGDTSWAADPRTSRTLEAIRSLTRLPETVSRESNLELDVGLDSIGRVELLAALEARLGVSLADEVTHSIHTIGDLVDAVRDADVAPGSLGDSDSDPWSSLLDVSDDDPAVAPLLVKRPLLAAALFVASRFLFVVAWLLLGLRVSGREHLPKEGPFLISPNHQSYLDAFLLVSTLPYRVFRNAFYVGASEYFSTPLLGWVARMIHVVPVDPDTNLVHAMRAGFHGLRGGKILILFPEGERSIDATVKTFKKGAAILSLKAGAPIVPVALDGMHDIWPRAGRPRLGRLLSLRARTRIRFGPPLEPATGQYRPEEAYASATQRLRSSVEELLSSLRGRDPRLAE